MKPLNIPVVPFGAGSQPAEDQDLEYLPMPQGMSTFAMPRVPETDDIFHLAAARCVIERLLDLLRKYQIGDPVYPRLELTHLDAETRQLLNQVLGQGEVSAIIAQPSLVKIQETVFVGVWRVQHYAHDKVLAHDYLEACSVPEIIRTSALGFSASNSAIGEPPPGVMNAPALLNEILGQAGNFAPGNPAHVINLTLLPLTPEDLGYLQQSLGRGAVTFLSRGYGNCRITSTALRNVWWVQYFNNMENLILNTIEVVDVPEVAQAAREDLQDSVARLDELLQWMS